MPKFLFKPLVGDVDAFTSRLGTASGSANNLTDAEVGKFVKLVGDSQYSLCAVTNEIEGYIVAVEVATQDEFTIGSVAKPVGRKSVTFDGLQATPGTGTVAVGDYVYCGTVVAKGTALTYGTPAKVVKATDQTIAKNSAFAARVVSLGTAATGAVGTTGLIEFVGR